MSDLIHSYTSYFKKPDSFLDFLKFAKNHSKKQGGGFDAYDTSNRLYVLAKQKMIEAMSQIFKTIDEMKRKHDVNDLRELDFIKQAGEKELTYSSIAEINKNKDFYILVPKEIVPMTKISFSKPTIEVEKVKESMDVKTNKAVGEKLFEYYCEMEEL